MTECSRPDPFGGHHKPFVPVPGGRYRICAACGAVDDERSARRFAVSVTQPSVTDVAAIEAVARAAKIRLRWEP